MNDRRVSPPATQPAAPPVNAQIYNSAWRRKQQHQAAGEEPGDAQPAAEAQPAVPQVPHPEPAPEPTPEPAPELANDTSFLNLDRPQPSLVNPFINPGSPNWVPAATDSGLETLLGTASSPRQPFSLKRGPFNRRR